MSNIKNHDILLNFIEDMKEHKCTGCGFYLIPSIRMNGKKTGINPYSDIYKYITSFSKMLIDEEHEPGSDRCRYISWLMIQQKDDYWRSLLWI